MNTKKKHKNRPKPSPNPPTKVEAETKETDDVVSKSDLSEEIVETTADEVQVTIPIVKSEVESEPPKKPKRKGKKKSQEKENADTQENIQNKTLSLEDQSKESDVQIPSARKKKNKKKIQEQSSNQVDILETESVSTPEETEVTPTEEVQEANSSKAEESRIEIKSKKKSKKKKRNDSEKSDKSEEVTCTSAFKQLLIENELTQETESIENNSCQTKDDSNVSMMKSQSKLNDDIKITEQSKDCKISSTQDNLEMAKSASKKKHKNKKDKKCSQEEQENITQVSDHTDIITEYKQFSETDQTYSQEGHRNVTELCEKVDTNTQSKQCLEREPIICEVIQEPIEPAKSPEEPLDIIRLSLSSKAKIAKPVEKKRKGQQEDSTNSKKDESKMDRETESPLENFNKENLQTPFEKPEIVTMVEDKSEKVVPMVKNKIDTVDNLKLPDAKLREKKRKKSPKPQNTEADVKTYEEVKELTQISRKTEVKADSLHEKLVKTDKNVESSSKTEHESTISNIQGITLPKSEKNDDVPPLLNIDDTDVLEFTDTRGAKKKKKTPKVPVSKETSFKEIKQLSTPEATETKDCSKINDQLKTERESESSTALLSETEIQSVKTDDSGSSCDATPDIHFMRSSSQLVRNPNESMTIQEISNIDVEPSVKDSSEIPVTKLDQVQSGIQLIEPKFTEKKEPTYLKSKMMEVNKDMEELRLSLEKSLAEFTALEKSEQKVEKDYEPDRAECERTFADVKLPQPKELIVTSVQLPLDAQKTTQETESPLSVTESCPTKKPQSKGKSKKKGKQETTMHVSSASISTASTDTAIVAKHKEQEKTEKKTDSTEDKGKQKSDSTEKKEKKQSDTTEQENLPIAEQSFSDSLEQLDFAPIDNFEDALTTSVDDVNKTFEMIANEMSEDSQKHLVAEKPEINITAPTDDTNKEKENDKKDEKVNPVSQPKNFLGHTDIPAQSNRTDYKKEKNKTPNERQAKVKIKDSTDIAKKSKESQTDAKTVKKIDKSEKESYSRVLNDNEEYVYKYSFRKVFLQSACHICHKDLDQRVPCGFCNLVFYCSTKHKDEDWPQHQALCFAVSTIAHLKDQKHIYADAQRVTGQEYRLLRMQMIVSCEKVLKRRLVPWEQEAMLYPRMCGEVSCREWRQGKLRDCEGCGQISYCVDRSEHLPRHHQRWCKSYHLYGKLVGYQQTRGRLEPALPTKVLATSRLADKMNEVLAAMYEEKIDMNDIQYAALTQLATAPLTAAHCLQLYSNKMNSVFKKSSLTIHVVGAELQFEADALHKWEVFFLHLRPDLRELSVVLISPALNPGDLPLHLLGKIRLCDHCRQNKRRIVFSFQDKKTYSEYRSSEDFVSPDLVCAFNPSIQRSSVYSGKDPWPQAINSIIKQKVPFIITGYTLAELRKDIARVKACSEIDFKVITEPVCNSFASVRPDRNFISDDEMPLLFKNYCVSVLCGC